jgi:hypothetical protein
MSARCIPGRRGPLRSAPAMPGFKGTSATLPVAELGPRLGQAGACQLRTFAHWVDFSVSFTRSIKARSFGANDARRG